MNHSFLVNCTNFLCLSCFCLSPRSITLAQSVPSGLPGSVQPPRQELPPPQNLPSPVPTPRLTIPETAPPLPSSLPTAKIKVQRIEVFGRATNLTRDTLQRQGSSHC